MKFLFVVLLFFGFSTAMAELSDSCDCPEVKCDNPCQTQEGVTFYTEKCDGGKKVKSCAKPTCIVQEDPTKACLAWEKSKGIKRTIASQKKAKKQESEAYIAPPPKVGQIDFMRGKAWLKSENGARRTASIGMHVRETDTIITDPAGRVKVTLKDGNVINVLPNSQAKVTQFENEKESKKVLLDLLKGKMRSKVNKKFKGANYFKVRTKSAVAGVRGTDFVVSFEVNQKAITKVETITGEVNLASGDSKQSQNVIAGETTSFVVAANTGDVFNEDEISDFISRGYMTPVYKMSESQVKKLRWETEVDKNRQVAKVMNAKKVGSTFICAAPKGKMNQCNWECVNNPKGEKRCRTDLPQVNCVRKRCNANGEWADESRLPASYYEQCDAKGVKVAPCDY